MNPVFQKPTYTYKAKVVKVIDGDTIDVRLDVGFDTHIFKRLRLLGVDTWELRGDERERGLVAKEFVESRMRLCHNEVYVQTEMDGEGKYGRVLAWVWTENVSGITCLNEELIEYGHGTPIDY